MNDIIEETIGDDEIAKLKHKFEESKTSGGEGEITAKFHYAYSLLRSIHSQDTMYGISLLEELYYQGNQTNKRDYLYYIAIGQTRLKKYDLALDCINHFLQFEPENRQAKQLRSFIKEKLTKEGIVGMAITGGAALVLGGLIGLGYSLAKK